MVIQPPLIEQGGKLGQDFVNDRCRTLSSFRPPRGSRSRARLVTANNAGGSRSSARERHGETANTGEIAAGRDRQHHRHLRQPIEGARRYDEHQAAALLLLGNLMTGARSPAISIAGDVESRHPHRNSDAEDRAHIAVVLRLGDARLLKVEPTGSRPRLERAAGSSKEGVTATGRSAK
jgi:hypothetical protein